MDSGEDCQLYKEARMESFLPLDCGFGILQRTKTCINADVTFTVAFCGAMLLSDLFKMLRAGIPAY